MQLLAGTEYIPYRLAVNTRFGGSPKGKANRKGADCRKTVTLSAVSFVTALIDEVCRVIPCLLKVEPGLTTLPTHPPPCSRTATPGCPPGMRKSKLGDPMLHEALFTTRNRMYTFSIDEEFRTMGDRFLVPFGALARHLHNRRAPLGKKPMIVRRRSHV